MAHDHFYGICENKCLVEITAESIPGLKSAVVDMLYPVGSIHMSVNSANPSTYFGGTWVSWGAGQVPVGVNASDSDFSTVEKTGGEKTHTLTEDEMPKHRHGSMSLPVNYASGTKEGRFVVAPDSSYSSTYINTTYSGNGTAHNNLQPYITCYMWKRTA